MPIHPVTALGPGFSTNYAKFQLGMIVQFDYVSKHSKRSTKRSVWIQNLHRLHQTNIFVIAEKNTKIDSILLCFFTKFEK